MAKFLYKIGDFAARRAWAVVLIWALILAGIGGAFAAFKGETTDEITIPGTEAALVQEQLKDVFDMDANSANGKVIVQTEDGSAFTDEQKKAVADAATQTGNIDGVTSVSDPFATQQQMVDGQKQMEDGQAKIDQGRTETANGEKQLDEAQAKIDETRAKFEAGEAPQEAWDEFNKNQDELNKNRDELNQKQDELDAKKQELEDGKTQLEDAQRQADEGRKQLEEANAPQEAYAEVDATQQEIDAKRAELEAGQQQIDDGQKQLDEGKQKLDDGQKQLDQAREQLENFVPTEEQWAELDAGQTEIDQNREKLEAGKTELDNGQKEIDRNKALMDMSSDAVMVNDDSSTGVVGVTFDAKVGSVPAETLSDARSSFDSLSDAGLKVSYDQNMEEQMPNMKPTGEIIGILIALIILVIMLGSMVAAGLPILMAIVGVGAATLGTLALSGAVEMTSTTPTLGTMLGLAVGIDYTLFILNRHRNNLAKGMPMRKSIAMAVGTSGSAVVFAGITVIIALLALNVVGIPFLSVMGNAAAFAVFMAVAVAITLGPAVLSLAGRRIVSKKRWAEIQRHNADRENYTAAELEEAHVAAQAREEKPTGWLKFILKSPIATILASIALLGLVAVPVASMRLGLPDATSESQDSTAYTSYVTLADEFGEGVNGPIVAAADLPDGTTAEQAKDLQVSVAQELAQQPNVDAVIPAKIADDNSMLLYQITPTEGPNAESTTELVHNLRDLKVSSDNGDITFGVTGQTAMAVDISENLFKVLPIYVGIVMGLSLIVLILVFRSILVPLTATIGFLFSLLASLGAATAIFQWGWMGSLFGVHTPGPILAFLPILAVGILFGLAMDYQVFLVSGMREAYAHGRDAKKSVIIGFNHNSKVVVAAALIMTGVFLGFVFSGEAMIASIGFALAAGVLFDAFIVRMTLIPALMYLLGKKAWWFPKWLDKIIPDLDVEGTKLEEEAERENAADATYPAGGKHLTGESATDEPNGSVRA